MPEIDTAVDDLSAVAEFQKLYPIKPVEAAEAAAEYLGIMTGVVIDIGNDETWTLPNPSLLSDDQEDRYNQELVDQQNEADKLDRGPDVLNDDGSFKAKGPILAPHRIDGVIVPNREVRIAKALMGPDVYAKFKAAGGKANQIALHWEQMSKFMREREAADSKSRGGGGPVVPVSD